MVKKSSLDVRPSRRSGDEIREMVLDYHQSGPATGWLSATTNALGHRMRLEYDNCGPGDLQRALPLLEQAVVMTPGSAIFNYHLGVVLFNKVDKEAAKERLRKAVESSEEFNGRDEALQTLERLS